MSNWNFWNLLPRVMLKSIPVEMQRQNVVNLKLVDFQNELIQTELCWPFNVLILGNKIKLNWATDCLLRLCLAGVVALPLALALLSF